MADISTPVIRIIWPPEDSLNPSDSFDIIGVSFDASGIQSVELTLTIPTFGQVGIGDRQPYVPAVQFKPGSWAIWSAHVTVQDVRFSRILARAVDGAGNEGYYDKFIRIEQPPPPPPPPIVFDFSKYRGVNFISEVLRNGPPTAKSSLSDIKNRMARMKKDGINFLRVPFYWDHMLANYQECLVEVENITREAGRLGIAVQWDHHHFHTGAYNGGDGFPTQYTNAYPLDQTITKTSDKAWRFWQAMVYDEIAGIRQAWWNMMQDVFDAADKGNEFNNWVGVEFLNEPQIPAAKTGETNINVYLRYKQLYQYFADKFRMRYGSKDQYILICEANGIGAAAGTGSLMPPRDKQYTCFPETPFLAYAAHRYNTPLDVEFEQTIPLIINTAKGAGRDVRGAMVQEWALGGTGLDPPSSAFMELYMNALKTANLGWSYWAAFGGSNQRNLYVSSTADPTGYALSSQAGTLFVPALKKVYG